MDSTNESRFPALQLNIPKTGTTWFDEPLLLFSGDQTHIDPQIGIPLYGPRSYGTSRHKAQVHVGFIGTAESVEKAREFMQECANGIEGDDTHVPFPGFLADRGFRSGMVFSVIRRINLLDSGEFEQDISAR